GEPVFHALAQIGIGGRPVGRARRQLGGGHAKRGVGGGAIAQGGGEPRRVAFQQAADQTVVGFIGHGGGRQQPRPDGAPHQALEHRRGAADGVVPVHVAIHLVLGEQQRLQGCQSFLVQRQRRLSRGPV